MKKKYIYGIIILSLLFIYIYFTISGLNGYGIIKVHTEKTEFSVGEDVKVYTKNIGLTPLGGSPNWEVYKINDKNETLSFFSWDDIPGKDSNRLIEFITQNYGANWVKNAKIEKKDNDSTVTISMESNYISLRLNDEKDKVTMVSTDGWKTEFTVKQKNGRLDIYEALVAREILKCCQTVLPFGYFGVDGVWVWKPKHTGMYKIIVFISQPPSHELTEQTPSDYTIITVK